MLRWAIAVGSTPSFRLTVLACGALLAAGPAQTQPAPDPDSQDTRFVFHEVDEGILRLDSKLGDVSLCSRQPLGWTCRLVADERKTIDAELARLQQDNAELRAALAARPERDMTETSAAPAETPAKPAAEAKPEPPAKAADPPKPTELPKAAEPATQAEPPKAAEPPTTAESAKPTEPAPKPQNTGDLARVRVVVATIWHRMVEMMARLRADLQEKG